MAMNSWRQYGGIYSNDKFQNVGVGTIVADKLLLRQTNVTQNKINGSLNVTGDIDASGQIIGESALVSKQNVYIQNKLFFGSYTPSTTTSNYYIKGDSINGYVGINTLTPSFALDINSDKTSVLALRSSNTNIQNILAENNSKNGITSSATTTSASLGFFVGNNVATGTPNNTISSTGQNLIVTSNIFKINANMCISNKSSSTNVFNESLTIYDNYTNPYLYDVYKNSSITTGSALSLVTSNATANTFMYLTTPTKIGGAIGGGAFPADSTRAMLSLGVTTPSDSAAAQLIVSGNNRLNYRTTTGFNTFSPKTENYVVDINGPTHIGNGEISTLITTNFQIIAMKFSRINNKIGFAVGTPNSKTDGIFTHAISTTINGGLSWTINSTAIPYTNFFGKYSETMNVFVYDDKTIYIASRDDNYLFYSMNGGNTFNFVNDTNTSAGTKQYTTLYATKNNNGNMVVFLGGTETSSETRHRLFYTYDLVYSSSNPTYNSIPSIRTNEMDGYGNYVYIVGSGIQKYDITGSPATAPVAQYGSTYNSGSTYNCVYAYSSTYVIAGGNGILSYTTDGVRWTDVSLPQYNIKSIYVYNTTSAVAVGDNGAFLYTTNGAQSWNPVPTAILNSSGIANRIVGQDCNLNGIYMPNPNSFVISNVITSYVLTTTANVQSITQYGSSKIMFGFFPAIFNSANNSVLDVSGNMGITGDILVNGNLVSTGAISTQTMNINNISFVQNQSGELAIYGNVRVNGILASTTLYAPSYIGLSVIGNTILSGNTTQTGDLSIVGTTTQTGDLSIVGTTTQTGNLSIVGTTTQTGDLSVSGNLIVNGVDIIFMIMNQGYGRQFDM
jgi:hypothetical protein